MIDKGNSGYDEFQHNDGKVGLSTTLQYKNCHICWNYYLNTIVQEKAT